MAVQIKPSQPKEQHNGLSAIEADILEHEDQPIVALVTYEVDKVTRDRKKGDVYPVLGIKHIEPLTGDLLAKAQELQQSAYQSRTGENELDFEGVANAEQPKKAGK